MLKVVMLRIEHGWMAIQLSEFKVISLIIFLTMEVNSKAYHEVPSKQSINLGEIADESLVNTTSEPRATVLTEDQNSSEDSSNQIEMYKLEICQLKRQNQFLKKKVEQLGQHKTKIKKSATSSLIKSTNGHRNLSQPKEKLSTASYFFREVDQLLKEFARINHLSPPSLQLNVLPLSETLKQVDTDSKDLAIRLEKMMLEEESKRFLMIVELFLNREKELREREKRTKEETEKLLDTLMRSNQSILEKIQAKKRNNHSIYTYNQDHQDELSNSHEIAATQKFTIDHALGNQFLDVFPEAN